MLTTSKDANNNYLAQIVEIKTINPHPNADSLQVTTINFQPVIVGMDTKVGDLGVYIPVEAKLSERFLWGANMYSSTDMNSDPKVKGYICKRGRVKALKLRGEYSMGLFIPLKSFESVTGVSFDENNDGFYFDTVNDKLFVKKYEVVTNSGTQKSSNGKKPEVSRLVDNQFHLHVDTDNLRRNAHELYLDNEITISYKMHGTSAVFSRCMVKKQLSIWNRIGKFIGMDIQETEYDLVYSSRRVVKNKGFQTKASSYYSTDHWGEMAEELKDKIPAGYGFYGEITGFGSNGEWIQKPYDYRNSFGKKSFHCYRVTFTNPEGMVHNLSTVEAEQLCTKLGINFVPIIYTGTVRALLESQQIGMDHWQENFVKRLEEMYNEKDCYMCENEVPEEGIILRVERSDVFQAYKLKSRRFLEYETKFLDQQLSGQ